MSLGTTWRRNGRQMSYDWSCRRAPRTHSPREPQCTSSLCRCGVVTARLRRVWSGKPGPDSMDDAARCCRLHCYISWLAMRASHFVRRCFALCAVVLGGVWGRALGRCCWSPTTCRRQSTSDAWTRTPTHGSHGGNSCTTCAASSVSMKGSASLRSTSSPKYACVELHALARLLENASPLRTNVRD